VTVARPSTRPLGPRSGSQRGFTLLELLFSLALFAIIGVALVSLLAQGMDVLTTGTRDTSVQDRFQAFWPVVREDLASIHVSDRVGVPPPPASVDRGPEAELTGPPPPPPAAPELRLRSGLVKLVDAPSGRPVNAFVAAWVRTNAREAEDPFLGAPTTAASRSELKTYSPATVDAGVTGNLLPTGGLYEVAYVALHVPPSVASERDDPSILTVFRCFRAPVGGKGSLLDVESLDTTAEVLAAGRPIAEGVLHFSISWRNVFAPSWDVPSTGKVQDGGAYAGWTWDSTRGDERFKDFALNVGKESLADTSDDVFPARARVELAIATPAPFGWRSATFLARPVTADDTTFFVHDADPLLAPGPAERWLKLGDEWVVGNVSRIDPLQNSLVVVRARRSTTAREHPESTPIHLGASATTDVELTPRDRYVRPR
jgi:prepilin-type N-terminal cleavage/methylation domain-containing protein